MKILLTGASGFIGSALCPQLEQDGHEVYRMMRYVSGGRFDSYLQNDRVIFADLRDGQSVDYAIDKVRPEVVIHLGAVSQVAYSFDHPDEVRDVVLGGTVRVAEACKRYGVKCLIHASTSEVYGKSGHNYTYPCVETEPLGGTSPYGSAKVGAEEYLEMMRLGGFPVVIMRPFNSFGRANITNRHYVTERAITGALQQGVVNLHDPYPLRDFVFREDHVRAYRMVVANYQKAIGQNYNICTGQVWSVEQMANMVAEVTGKLTGKTIRVEFLHHADRPSDIDILHGSNEKIKRLLGWEPQWDFAKGLTQAIAEWAKVLDIKLL